MKSYLEKFRLDDKVACVIGGVGLIGSEITSALSDAGATALILDVNEEKGTKLAEKITNDGNHAEFIYFDVTDLERISENFKMVFKDNTSIDVFVNCSYPRTKDWGHSTFKEISLESFRKNIDLHMNSYVWSAREVAEIMSKQANGGSIVLLSSIYGILGQDLTVYEGTDMGENMSYAVIKGGITNFTRQMAAYYGQYNIRVNTLCPGGVFDNQDPTFVKNYSNKTPLKRMANLEEIASAALFLSTDAASYISGITLLVDGGYSNI
jgi:NAD(P)-dependent dehydrogenase (short-subunit alcohol dehydrogenase family)